MTGWKCASYYNLLPATNTLNFLLLTRNKAVLLFAVVAFDMKQQKQEMSGFLINTARRVNSK